VCVCVCVCVSGADGVKTVSFMSELVGSFSPQKVPTSLEKATGMSPGNPTLHMKNSLQTVGLLYSEDYRFNCKLLKNALADTSNEQFCQSLAFQNKSVKLFPEPFR